ncbi:MAG: hypothetical protein AAF745_00125 [Planctomycetota bacterium]
MIEQTIWLGRFRDFRCGNRIGFLAFRKNTFLAECVAALSVALSLGVHLASQASGQTSSLSRGLQSWTEPATTMPATSNARRLRDTRGLEHVNVQPPYAPLAAMRSEATLRFVDADPSGTAWLAVGDLGVILRSDDAGQTWQDVSPAMSSSMGGHLGLTRVSWLNRQSVRVLGRGWEPGTAMQRRFSWISNDAGQTWRFEALRDTDFNAKLNVATSNIATPVSTRSTDLHTTFASQRSRHDPEQGDTRLVDATVCHQSVSGNVAIAVGRLGMIHRRQSIQDNRWSPWRTVRHGQRRFAVIAMIADSDGIPWPVLGRESLQDRNRVGIAIANASEDERLKVSNLAAMWGITVLGDFDSAIQCTGEPAATVWLIDHNLNDTHKRGWFQKGQQAGVHVVEFRSQHKTQPDGSQPNHRDHELLHTNALLPQGASAVTVGDLAIDASLMMGAEMKHRLNQSTWHLSTVHRARRDDTHHVWSAARPATGLTRQLAVPQSARRDPTSSQSNASLRRMQIVTARLNQVKRFLAASNTCSGDELPVLIEQLLMTVAREDRPRVLWSLWCHRHQLPIGSTRRDYESAMLRKIRDFGEWEPLCRWARLKLESIQNSVEARFIAQPKWAEDSVSTAWGFGDQSSKVIAQAGGAASAIMSQETLSPFAIQPVTHAATINAIPSPIFVPKSHTPLPLIKSRQMPSPAYWDHLPQVMATRQLLSVDAPELTGPAINVPRIRYRPKLDGRIESKAWPKSPLQKSIRCARDDEYVYIAASLSNATTNEPTINLQLDTDGDLLSTITIHFAGDGSTSSSIDERFWWHPRLHTAIHHQRTGQSNFISTIEVALAIDELPMDWSSDNSGVLRVRVARASSMQQTMPNSSAWTTWSLRR